MSRSTRRLDLRWILPSCSPMAAFSGVSLPPLAFLKRLAHEVGRDCKAEEGLEGNGSAWQSGGCGNAAAAEEDCGDTIEDGVGDEMPLGGSGGGDLGEWWEEEVEFPKGDLEYYSLHQGISGWVQPLGSSVGLVVKKTIRYNFVGQLLGPRRNSPMKVEANTGCRVLIRGRGSIQDHDQLLNLHNLSCIGEMRGKPGMNHGLEFKKQQLRNLEMLNGTLHKEGSHTSGFAPPFHKNLGPEESQDKVLTQDCHSAAPAINDHLRWSLLIVH
ncbi:KH domain-containing protein [Musa troglodytarum]|uniref:KH domain-containing protein n=1 Tax=Musa troglodytarum TaxID=320322 RepID=A0A9E7FCW6_9LILI|nr:KH domain-containing protein [Musa troglodytarum]